jgi:hypothetical protein
MKKLATAFVFCGLLVAPLASVSAGDDGAWFDMENCGMCKNMSAEKGLMENMQWENVAIENGLLSICTVDKKYDEAYKRSQKKMQETSALLMKGEKMDLCGFCKSYGSLMMAGAMMENVETKAGHIMLMTSDNPEVVKQMHAHVERTNEEMAKMMNSKMSKGSHEGHSHD